MKFKANDIKNLFWDEEAEGFELIAEGNWVDDGKYSHCSILFKFEDKYYRKSMSRSGNYHTDYYYDCEWWGDEVECEEVQPKQKMVTVWERVKEAE